MHTVAASWILRGDAVLTPGTAQSQTFEGYMPIWTSALFGVVMLAAALAVFARRDF